MYQKELTLAFLDPFLVTCEPLAFQRLKEYPHAFSFRYKLSIMASNTPHKINVFSPTSSSELESTWGDINDSYELLQLNPTPLGNPLHDTTMLVQNHTQVTYKMLLSTLFHSITN